MSDTVDVTVRIRVLNSEGDFLGGHVDIEFENQSVTDFRQIKDVDASRDIDVADLMRFRPDYTKSRSRPPMCSLPTGNSFRSLPEGLRP